MRRVERGAFAASELNRVLRKVPDGRDRALITDLVYGTLRHLPYLEAALAQRLRAPERLPAEVRTALAIAGYERLVRGTPAHAAVDSWVEVVAQRHPRLAGLSNAVLRRLGPPGQLDRATDLRLPSWLDIELRRALGDASDDAARGMLEPEPLWLTAHAPDATRSLEADGCEVQPGPLPGTLRVRPGKSLAELDAFRRGKVQPQNPSSAAIAGLLEAAPGEPVYDLASGHGIKTAQLARAGAEVTAVEIDPRRVAAAQRNLARLGLTARHLQADLTDIAAPGLRSLEPVARVLLDAPCSGTGTLRGHPEIKLRLTPEQVEALASQQAAMLDTATELTSAGGRLLYAVCALTLQEGEAQIEAFVGRHPDFAAEPLEPPLPSVVAANGRYILPLDGCDGFYVARLRRAN